MSETVRQRLLDSFDDRPNVDQKALAESIDLILYKIHEAGFVIVPVSQMIATDVADFEATIRQWVTPSVDKLEEAVQVFLPIDVVVQDLKQRGWHIIPPTGTLTYSDIETSIKQHVNLTIGKTEDHVNIDAIPAEAIIQTLRQKGWFILPPRS